MLLPRIYIALIVLFGIKVNAQQPVFTQNVFAFIGDYGVGDEDEFAVSQLVKSWQPEAIITLGDNNYPDGSAATIDAHVGKFFHEYIHPYTGVFGAGADSNRFWPALGNHDLMTAGGQPYFNYFTLPNNERYYDVRNGDVHFFILNSDQTEPDGCHDSSLQALWLKSKLLASNAKWKIVVAHHAPYSSDDHYQGLVHMQWPFKSWGADVVLSGHAHVYERLNVDNLTYIICGLGGHSKYGFSPSPHPGSQARYNQRYGAVQMKVGSAELQFRFFNIDNQKIDSVHVSKNAIGIGEQNEDDGFHIYPNPARDQITIRSEAPLSNATLRLSNSVGQVLRELKNVSGTATTIPCGALINGVYFLQVEEGNREITIKKFMLTGF